MFLKTLLFLFLSINLYAESYLKSEYFVENREIMLSDIVKNSKSDFRLFTIDESRYSKRVKSKELLKILNANGIKNYKSKHAYVQFTKKSPINTTKIEEKIKQVYTEKYKNIEIETISVKPRGYLPSLPDSYETVLKSKSHLSRAGILYIKTKQNKKIFFNYEITAKVTVFETKKNIKRNTELSNINSKKKSIILNKFRAMPLQSIQKGTLQSKHNLKQGSILTKKDVQGLYLVTRGSQVNVVLNDSNIAISFSAKAQQNGKYGDIITVLNSSNKKIKVRVTGKRRAEVQ